MVHPSHCDVFKRCVLIESSGLNRLSQNTVDWKLSLSNYVWTSMYCWGFWASPSGSEHKIVGPFSPHVLISSINTPLISGSSVGTLNHTLYRNLLRLQREREREKSGILAYRIRAFCVALGLVTGAQAGCGLLWPCGPDSTAWRYPPNPSPAVAVVAPISVKCYSRWRLVQVALAHADFQIQEAVTELCPWKIQAKCFQGCQQLSNHSSIIPQKLPGCSVASAYHTYREGRSWGKVHWYHCHCSMSQSISVWPTAHRFINYNGHGCRLSLVEICWLVGTQATRAIQDVLSGSLNFGVNMA